MREIGESRFHPFLHFAFAATLTLAAAVVPTGAAADNPTGRTARPGADCTVCIVGTPVVQWSGTTGSLHVDRVENRAHASARSTDLGLQVRLQSDLPVVWRKLGVGEYGLSDVVPLGPLPIGSSRSSVDSGLLTFDGSEVPAGEYFGLVMIVDAVPGRPHFEDFVVMDDKVWCDGSACAVGRPCSAARIAGTWGYTKTGTLLLPSGPAPFASLGILTLGLDGTLTGKNTGSVGGNVSVDVLEGTYQMEPDCTGTMTVEVRDPSGVLLRTLGMGIVLDEDDSHVRGIVTSLVLPNGVSLPSIITADARRMTSRRGNAR